ncbi:hypothetical protein MMC30_000554 [Trapelia coarctata]|nr:hypothetical protein [Trapelia coarctata]
MNGAAERAWSCPRNVRRASSPTASSEEDRTMGNDAANTTTVPAVPTTNALDRVLAIGTTFTPLRLPAWFHARPGSLPRAGAQYPPPPAPHRVTPGIAVRVPPVQEQGCQLRHGAGAQALCVVYGNGEGTSVVL